MDVSANKNIINVYLLTSSVEHLFIGIVFPPVGSDKL